MIITCTLKALHTSWNLLETNRTSEIQTDSPINWPLDGPPLSGIELLSQLKIQDFNHLTQIAVPTSCIHKFASKQREKTKSLILKHIVLKLHFILVQNVIENILRKIQDIGWNFNYRIIQDKLYHSVHL